MPGPTTNPEIVYDEAGRVLDANQAAAELTGIPLGRLRGMHMRDFHHPDELPAAEERIRTMPFNRDVTFERWFRCCNRRYMRVNVTGSRRLLGGYRAVYVPVTGEQVDLPNTLAEADPQAVPRKEK